MFFRLVSDLFRISQSIILKRHSSNRSRFSSKIPPTQVCTPNCSNRDISEFTVFVLPSATALFLFTAATQLSKSSISTTIINNVLKVLFSFTESTNFLMNSVRRSSKSLVSLLLALFRFLSWAEPIEPRFPCITDQGNRSDIW